MINLNERCHSVMGVGFVLQCMLCEGHPGVHKYEPDQQFDRDPRFDEGGEFHEEANPDLNVLMATDVVGDLTYWTKRKFLPDGTSELLWHGSHPTPPANLQSNIPKALMRPTLLQARRIVARVQDSLCSPGFDKNDATGLLAQVVAMLDAAMEEKR